MSARSVQILGPRSQGGAVITTQFPLHLVDEGLLFTTNINSISLADDASLDLLIQTPASTRDHILISSAVGGDAEAEFFTDTTFSVAGTAEPAFNRNFNSSNVAQTTFTSGPTLTSPGTLVETLILPGGNAARAVGGTGAFAEELILAPSSNYLVRVFNRSSTANVAQLTVTLFEEQI